MKNLFNYNRVHNTLLLTKKSFSNWAVSLLTFILLLSMPALASADTSSQIYTQRIAGQSRYDTSAQIAQSGWKNSDYAIIASGDDFPDALCGAPLAKKYNAPILLTSKESLVDQAKSELISLNVKNVIIIGGTAVISPNVEQQIANMGIQVKRIAGNDRYETSFKVAQAMGQFSQAVIATGENFPDALSIAPIAAMNGMPILLTPRDNLPDGLKDYLSQNVKNTYVIGGDGVVSDNVINQLPSPKRLFGLDRYETNINIIKEFSNKIDFGTCYIATGENYPDALAGSALASLTKSPIILVSNSIDESTSNFINIKITSIHKIVIFGGTSIVSDSVRNGFTQQPESLITQEKAASILSDYLLKQGISKDNDPNLKIVFDRLDNAQGKEYYVFHVFDNLKDHIGTIGWYGVQINDGSLYDFILMNPVN